MNTYLTAFAVGLCAASAVVAESWDMPTPYGDSTFHTVNIRQFAADVETATNGGLTITVHSAGSLIPHGEIKTPFARAKLRRVYSFCRCCQTKT